MDRQLVLIAHNLRSCHNVGSLLRTAEGLAVETVYLTGYSPYPELPEDKRLPHLRRSITDKIHKTALGAEKQIKVVHEDDINKVINELKTKGFTLAALEQTKASITLNKYTPPSKISIIVGREVDGLEPSILKLVDIVLEIPMLGQKESFNVAEAASMCLYDLRFNH